MPLVEFAAPKDKQVKFQKSACARYIKLPSLGRASRHTYKHKNDFDNSTGTSQLEPCFKQRNHMLHPHWGFPPKMQGGRCQREPSNHGCLGPMLLSHPLVRSHCLRLWPGSTCLGSYRVIPPEMAYSSISNDTWWAHQSVNLS